jgi:hypothetical protein
MGGKPKPATQTTTTQQTQNNDPWAPAAPLLIDMLNNAKTAYANTPKTGTYVPPNADQMGAVDLMRGLAGRAGQGENELRQLGVATARGDFLRPESNPYLAGAMDAATRPIMEGLNRQVMSVADAASAAGAYGGDRSALLNARAIGNTNQAVGDTRAQMLLSNYEAERARQVQAGALLMDANSIGSQPALLMDQVGQQLRGFEQEKLLAAMDAPWAGLDRYAAILQGVTPYGTSNSNGTQTTVGTPARASGGQSALSGALGGASAGAAFGPWGAGIGAVVGGLGGLFGR